MGSKKTKTTEQSTATTTPNTPAAAQPAINNYYGKINGLFDLPASDVAPGLNGLQQASQNQAIQNIGQNSGTFNQAAQGAIGAMGAASGGYVQPVTAATSQLPDQYQTATVARAATPTAAQADVATLPGAYLAGDTSGLSSKDVATYGGASAAGGINQYMNPLLNDYVDATMTDYWDNAGRQQAAYARKGAQNKAFSDSRYGFGEAQMQSDLTRGGATTRAGLYSDAWNKALGAASGDADRANSAGIASMQAQNQRDETLASLARDYGLSNADALNSFGMAGYNAQNTANLANADSLNALLSQAFGIEANANSQDANAQNDALQQFYQAALQNGQFNAGQQNQVNLANNQDKLSALAQQISAAGTLGNIASGRADSGRADATTLGNLGNSLWGIQQQQNLAPYTQAGLLSDAINGGGLLNSLTGQTINTSGTSTSKESGGLLQSLLGAAGQLGAAAITKSERRVKHVHARLGGEHDGLGIYAYNYHWDDRSEPVRIGVMVDEVARLRPWALGPIVDGIQTVDYSKLEAN